MKNSTTTRRGRSDAVSTTTPVRVPASTSAMLDQLAKTYGLSKTRLIDLAVTTAGDVWAKRGGISIPHMIPN